MVVGDEAITHVWFRQLQCNSGGAWITQSWMFGSDQHPRSFPPLCCILANLPPSPQHESASFCHREDTLPHPALRLLDSVHSTHRGHQDALVPRISPLKRDTIARIGVHAFQRAWQLFPAKYDVHRPSSCSVPRAPLT